MYDNKLLTSSEYITSSTSMNSSVYYLTPEENKTLSLICQGFSSRHINSVCIIPDSGWHAFTYGLRVKTGIRNLKDSSEIRSFLERHQKAITGERPTPEQLSALRHAVVPCLSFLAMWGKDSQVLLGEACARAGIFTQDERARRWQIRLYLALFHRSFLEFSPQEEQILRAMAEGKTFQEISQMWINTPDKYVVMKSRELCCRLGFDAPGHMAQRNLLRAYFAYLDAQKGQITMDDSMF